MIKNNGQQVIIKFYVYLYPVRYIQNIFNHILKIDLRFLWEIYFSKEHFFKTERFVVFLQLVFVEYHLK